MAWTGEIHISEMARVTRKSRTILYRWRALNWLRPTSKVGNSERFSAAAYERACEASLKADLPTVPRQAAPRSPVSAGRVTPAPSAIERIRSAFNK